MSRSPHGERGLKYKLTDTIKNLDKSLPARGAWIEIFLIWGAFGGGWSLPARGAWIEIAWQDLVHPAPWHVAPRTGSVD